MKETIKNFRKALGVNNNAAVDTAEFENILIFLSEYMKREKKKETEKTRIKLMKYLGKEYADKVYKDYVNAYEKILEEYINDNGSDVDKHKKHLLNDIESEMLFKITRDTEIEEVKNYIIAVLSGDNPGLFKAKKRRDLTHIISTIGELIKAGY